MRDDSRLCFGLMIYRIAMVFLPGFNQVFAAGFFVSQDLHLLSRRKGTASGQQFPAGYRGKGFAEFGRTLFPMIFEHF